MKMSLRTKTVILIILIAAILSTAGILVSTQAMTQVVNDTYRGRASDIANSLAVILDKEKVAAVRDEVLAIYHATEEKVGSEEWGSPAFEAYTARFDAVGQTEAFQALREQIRSLQDVNQVDCLYLVAMDPDLENFIYIVDGAYEDACPPGCFDPLLEQNRDLLKDPTIGFPPYISNLEPYGQLVTAGAPVYDGQGAVIGYAMADISMDMIRSQQHQYVLIHSSILVVLTFIVCIVGIWAVNRFIIRPINRLSSAAAHYSAGNEDNSELDNLQIKTRDEIQSLTESFQQMTRDIKGYIDNLMATTQELTRTRIEANEMNELAHRDALTGVGSKLAYDGEVAKLTEEIRQGNARFGIVMVDMNGLKHLNDTYGHEKGNVAIRKTCSVICEVFSHSPVYRFGGDEFVVVIRNRDYDSIDQKIEQFRQLAAQPAAEPWEKVDAAIGYALYNGDDSVDDVFRRADHIMYERKKAMKDGAR